MMLGASRGGPLLNIVSPILALVFTGLTTGILIYDLKRPDRFYYLLTKPNLRSWLVLGGYILMAYSLASVVWLAYGTGTGSVPVWVIAACGILGIGSAGYSRVSVRPGQGPRPVGAEPALSLASAGPGRRRRGRHPDPVRPRDGPRWPGHGDHRHHPHGFTDRHRGSGAGRGGAHPHQRGRAARHRAAHPAVRSGRSSGACSWPWASFCRSSSWCGPGQQEQASWLLHPLSALLALIGLWAFESLWVEAGQAVPLS